MDNLNSPASPFADKEEGVFYSGFTKLEKAALMIAQGLVAKYYMKEPGDQKIIAQMSVELATEIINEANK